MEEKVPREGGGHTLIRTRREINAFPRLIQTNIRRREEERQSRWVKWVNWG
jgi:hypothetical protein